jgi:septal ring factor EnvC (AmiA/AmiB activator)
VINTGVLAHGKSLEVVLFGGISSMFQREREKREKREKRAKREREEREEREREDNREREKERERETVLMLMESLFKYNG